MIGHSQPPVRCVALDFDLTMFDYRHPADTCVLDPWFRKLDSHAVLLGIASGRTLADLQEELTKIGMTWAEPFPHFVIHEEFHIHWPAAPNPGSIREWNRGCDRSVEALCREVRPYFDSCVAKLEDFGTKLEAGVTASPAGLTIVLENPEGAETVRAFLEATVPTSASARISRNHHIVLATPSFYHKGSALDFVRDEAGIPADQLMAIGDNLNDLAMMEVSRGFRCGTVSNAEPLVREAVARRGGFLATLPIAFGVTELFETVFESFGSDSAAA